MSCVCVCENRWYRHVHSDPHSYGISGGSTPTSSKCPSWYPSANALQIWSKRYKDSKHYMIWRWKYCRWFRNLANHLRCIKPSKAFDTLPWKKNWFAGFLNHQQYLSTFWFITTLLPSKVRVLNLLFPTIGPVGWGVSVGIVAIKTTTISMMIKPRNVARRDCPGTSWHLQLSILLPATHWLKDSIFCCCVRDSTVEKKCKRNRVKLYVV